MECKKEDAIKAMEVARLKLRNGDFEGAERFALKAKKLFPDLQDIMQLLTLCNVHHCAEHKLCGSEMDWYGILLIERSADESFIKKQYRKLALLLHPDKNKFTGAEAAFKLIGEAIAVLTDQTKRSQYDTRIASKTTSTSVDAEHARRYQYDHREAAQNPKPTPDPSKTTDASVDAEQTRRSQYDHRKAEPNPKPTPDPSKTANARANAYQTKRSQYDHRKAAPNPKPSPDSSKTVKARANTYHRTHSQYYTKTAPKQTPHGPNTTCAGSANRQYESTNNKQNGRSNVETAAKPPPHQSNATGTAYGGRQYVSRNNNKNGSNFASHRTFRPPCSAYHHHYSVVCRWFYCPSCGSSIGGNFL